MKRIAAAIAMSCTVLLAGYKVDLDKLPTRTLPQETYAKLVKGKGWNGLSWAWKDEDYDHSLGWALQSVSFRSPKEVPTTIQDYLKDAIGKLEDRQSPYRLNLAVVDFGEITSFPKSGFVTVEGTVTLFGKPLAAFVTCETVTSKDAGGYRFQYAVDDILKSFVGEIMLPQGGETIIPLAKPFPRDVLAPRFAQSEAAQRLQAGIEALDKKNAFRDRPLGMPIEAFLGKGKARPEQKRGLVILTDPKDDLDLGRARAKAIRYVFWKGKLARVEMEFPTGDQVAARVHQALKVVYGRGVWGNGGTRPYLDCLGEVLRARGGYGRNPVAVNPIVWEGKQVSMMLDGLASGPDARRNVMGPVLLTLDCVPIVEALRKELLEEDQARGAEKPNI